MVAGKTIAFDDGARLAASENILMSGVTGGRLTLASAVAEGSWTLDSSAAASIQVFETNVSNCNSVVEVTVFNGAGDDNTNILFSTVVPGETLTWSGAEGTEWCNSTNWTPAARAPVATDHVIIPSGAAHMPVLPVSAVVASINLQSGATLTLGNRSLTVAGVSTLAGKLVFSGAGEFNALGDVNCSGVIVAAQSVFRLAGASSQSAKFSGITLYELSIENPSVTIGGDFACNRFSVGDGATAYDVGFSSGMTMAATEFIVGGDTSVTNVTLHTAPPSGTWHLNASKASVSGAKVSGSDASAGVFSFKSFVLYFSIPPF